MIVEYDKDYLLELYENGCCKNKRFRFQPQVVRKYQRRIDTLMAATRLEDLYVFNSLNFEALQSSDMYSVRIDKQYRLEFRAKNAHNDFVVTVCRVIDITNHYQ
jgi:proteic killer suppression protein